MATVCSKGGGAGERFDGDGRVGKRRITHGIVATADGTGSGVAGAEAEAGNYGDDESFEEPLGYHLSHTGRSIVFISAERERIAAMLRK
jgi:hypothetical protein